MSESVQCTTSGSQTCCSCRPAAAKKAETPLERLGEKFHSLPVQLAMAAVSGVSLILSLFGTLEGVLPFDPAWVAIVISGTPLLVSAAQELLKKHITAEALVSTAILATLYTGDYFAGGEVALIMALGHLLEDWTIHRARSGIEKLIQLTPKTARRIEASEEASAETVIPASEVRKGDVLRVLPGEAIPVDGKIVSGSSSIDQQLVSGESLPVDKTVGDEVYAGTINCFGALTVEATKVGEDSSLARMIQLVHEAEMRKAPLERITDRWASFLVPTAILVAILVGLATGNLTRAVTILIVFCPCSLVLATPTAIVAAIGNASKYGILIRSGEVLERLGKITGIAFDKTGTLTWGRPALGSVCTFDEKEDAQELLALAGALERHSEHPLSRCILETAEKRNLGSQSLLHAEASDVEILPGLGIAGRINDQNVLIGNERLLNERGVTISESQHVKAQEYLQRGETVVWIAVDSVVHGLISLTDTLRETAAETVRQLKNAKIETLLLTGDNANASAHIAEKVGIPIQEVHAQLLPEDKQRIISERIQSGQTLAMVGDGINDAPALKTANVGIAMSKTGSDLAMEAADIALIGDDITRVPFLVRLSQKTVKTIYANIILSMSINFVAIILAATGWIDPVIGALVHNLGSVLVIFNASLLLKVKR